MFPILAAEDLTRAITQYLTTSFALADDDVRDELARFFADPAAASRVFRGPYLRIRTDFRHAGRGWERSLDWSPPEFRPYTHQAAAWSRLSTKDGHAPEPTIVTTGTGSGKTESFLVPILDHCRREAARGVRGVKALLLYPMNALADDQARRLDDLLRQDPELSAVTAGIYIGGEAGDWEATAIDRSAPEDLRASRLLTGREQIRESLPDILLTNYKMLDLLLHRIPDIPLWTSGTLRYVVLDEFHTYDGAQGTDVAMLMRRLSATTGLRIGEQIAPVGTSATLSGGDPYFDSGGSGDAGGSVASVPANSRTGAASRLLSFAGEIFGCPFAPEALIGEDRKTPEETVQVDYELPVPSPQELIAVGDPLDDRNGLSRPVLEALARLLLTPEHTGVGARSAPAVDFADPVAVGRELGRHRLVNALLYAAGTVDVRNAPRSGDGPGVGAPTLIDVAFMDAFVRHGAGTRWRRAYEEDPAVFVGGLSRLLALVSFARTRDEASGRISPFLRVEAQLWVREVRRVIRAATDEPHFRWFDDDGPTGDTRVNKLNLGVYQPRGADDTGDTGEGSLGADAATATEPIGSEKPASAGVPGVVAPAYRCHLPAVYCRHCGRSGWAAVSTELDWQQLDTRPLAIYTEAAKRSDRVRWMLRARPDEHDALYLDAEERTVSLASGIVPGHAVRVVTTPGKLPKGFGDTCPSCGLDDGMRFLGAGTATLASVITTQLFSDRHLAGTERKLLAFVDSVQDATHRAGFISHRAFGFTLRGLLTDHLRDDKPLPITDLALDAARSVTSSGNRASEQLALLASLTPPDLQEDPQILSLFRGEADRGAMDILQDRLVFATQLEFGLRSRIGRTLELTRTAAVEIEIPEPDELVKTLRDTFQLIPGQHTLPADPAQYLVYVRGLLERMRLRGAIYHPWLQAFVDQNGARRWPIWGGRPTGMPAFPRGLAAPRFLLDGEAARTEFDRLSSASAGTYLSLWAHRALQVKPADARAYNQATLRALADAGVVRKDRTSSGAIAYSLRPRHLLVHSLVTDEAAEHVNELGIRCSVCTWRSTTAPGTTQSWLGTHCLRFQCTGTYVPDDRDYREDFYRRLYSVDRPGRVRATEHTGALARDRREDVEKHFKHPAGPFDPNVLTCTPTLELGIDIGDLSAVLLASMPPGPANYAQRIGRAGRRSGDALVAAVVPRGARNQYFLHQPEAMLAGRIIPPGTYLDAVEILRRQYTAFLFDRAADGSLWADSAMPETRMPRQIGQLFNSGLAPDGWLRRVLDRAISSAPQLAAQWIALFPGMGKLVRAELESFAVEGIEIAVGSAATEWRAQLEVLQQRTRHIGRAFDALGTATNDKERAQTRRELFSERRAIRRRIEDLTQEESLSALVRLGLLPNYTLHDDGVTLDATLWWRTRDGEFEEHKAEYVRPARLALTEYAPGNTFYTDSCKYVIDAIDLGIGGGKLDAQPGVTWRVCAECGYVATEEVGAVAQCPRCGDQYVADPGAALTVITADRLLSRERREDARVDDSRDERERLQFRTCTLVDVNPAQSQGLRAWRVREALFGAEFARVAKIRTVNLGPAGAPGAKRYIAGEEMDVPGFETCPVCGAVRGTHPQAYDIDAGRIGTRHRNWCPQRGRAFEKEKLRTLVLAHELSTQALRLLLPVSSLDFDTNLASFKTALLLGITEYFGGAPDHLRAVPASMPGGDSDLRRRFLVLYDAQPGGTGYLEHLADKNVMRHVLSLARDTIAACPCEAEERQPCHRCLLRFASSFEHPLISRERALHMLDEILHSWTAPEDLEDLDTLSGVRVDALADSELEKRFILALKKWGANTDPALPGSMNPRAGARGVEFDVRSGATRWLLRDHVRVANAASSEPDFLLTRVDGPPVEVAVFLDGYAYHASKAVNRIADDSAKRTALRQAGTYVWQLTWEDVRAFEEAVDDKHAKRAPALVLFDETGLRDAQQLHRRVRGSAAPGSQGPDSLDPALANPVEALLAFLADPDPVRWARRAASLLGGLRTRARAYGTDRQELAAALPTILAEPGTVVPGPGTELMLLDGLPRTTEGRDGCRVLGILADRADLTAWSALIVLDDRDEALADPVHRERWFGWLAWSNLLQFLYGQADGGTERYFEQTCASRIERFDPHSMPALAGGMPTSVAEQELSRVWKDAIDLASPAVHELLAAIGSRAGALAPQVGFELAVRAADDPWNVELAWPHARLAVALDEDPDRDAAYREAGWRIERAADLTPTRLEELLHG